MAKVELYTTNVCPYCVKAKTLLKQKGVDYTEYNLNEDPSRQAEMVERAPGARTVPQIFINGKSIGGCDDLYALNSAGELDTLLSDGDSSDGPHQSSNTPKP